MSLVSYYDSDDNSASGEENEEAIKVEIKATKTITTAESKSRENDKTTPASRVTVLSGQISDDEDDMTVRPNDYGGIGSGQTDEGNFLHNNLPVPKSSVETVDEAGVVLDDKLEDEVKPKKSQMKDAPKPPPKRSKQPVRITIPKLQDDEDEPKQKKIKLGPSTQKSGLTSLLPPPVHAVKKESNRILVPHTLKRKPPPKPNVDKTKTASKKPNEEAKSLKKLTAFQAMTGYESDSDEENSNSGNFFSLDVDTENNAEHLELSKDLPPCLPSVSDILPDVSVTSQTGPVSTLPKITVNPDAPLGFNKGHNNPYSGALVNSQPSVSSIASSSNSHSDISQSFYNVPYSQNEEYSNNYEELPPVNKIPEVDDYLQDEQFLRIQGKKRRGKEDINIIEANMNDYINSNDIELTKTLTEESTHQPHRNKDSMPTGKEKRKHQITYLAFQAKEREFELKNAWAQGRATKRQTQSKYGF
ncbi:hypothetical protein LOTGIDRAFT_157968 [Lottia gigantea]|uniref:Proline-rich protein PRCC n=1 Tax=Lottia gigantea TaxID=225164 RepID=V4ATQ2_LOTGI|nr:hypothetical protein LOTGIDRAFT_157968 [Lottia gigantea]ESP00678.1 hypothetical protein LOTGIDRAFT_157968 [Lottia gigantea]